MLAASRPLRALFVSRRSTSNGVARWSLSRAELSWVQNNRRRKVSPCHVLSSRRVIKSYHTYTGRLPREQFRCRQSSLSLIPGKYRIEVNSLSGAIFSRSISSHRKSGPYERATDTVNDDEYSWSSRWQRNRRERYQAFVRRIEEDPYQALFGASNHWLGWLKNPSRGFSSPVGPTQQYLKHEECPTHKSKQTHSVEGAENQYPKGERTRYVKSSEIAIDYDIDPITLRKVPRQHSQTPPKSRAPQLAADMGTSIPVKKYRSSDARSTTTATCGIPSSQADEPAQHSHRHWLVQEGFQTATNQSPAPTMTRVESALDRHVARQSRVPSFSRQDTVSKDDVDLLRTADVRAASGLRGRLAKEDPMQRERRQDALERRFSELAVELDEKFAKESKPGFQRGEKDSSVVDRAEEKHPVHQTSNNAQATATQAQLTKLKHRIDTLNEDYASLKKKTRQEKHRLEEMRKAEAADRAQDLLETEIKRQQEAMQLMGHERSPDVSVTGMKATSSDSPLPGEGDVASNIHEFAGRSRWYKQKAPHANCEMDAKIQQIARDNAFVREVRTIYEESYGIIDTNHRQVKRPSQADKVANQKHGGTIPQPTPPSTRKGPIETFLEDGKEAQSYPEQLQEFAAKIDEALVHLRGSSPTTAESVIRATKHLLESVPAVKGKRTILDPEVSGNMSPTTYRILAFDGSSQRVISAKMEGQPELVDSCVPVDGVVTPLDALKHLDNPGKFLPHITNLQGKGFDITSASKDLVVLKKTRQENGGPVRYHGRPNPVDGTTTPEISAGNFASPTGYVSYSPLIPPEEEAVGEQTESVKPAEKVVRRQEDVFSGAPSNDVQESRRRTRSQRRKAQRKQTFKRMFWTGTLTASACYAVGAILEPVQI